jgi:hypothetical protein
MKRVRVPKGKAGVARPVTKPAIGKPGRKPAHPEVAGGRSGGGTSLYVAKKPAF